MFFVIVGEELIYQQLNVSECSLLGIMGSSGKADFLTKFVNFIALTVHLWRSTNEEEDAVNLAPHCNYQSWGKPSIIPHYCVAWLKQSIDRGNWNQMLQVLADKWFNLSGHFNMRSVHFLVLFSSRNCLPIGWFQAHGWGPLNFTTLNLSQSKMKKRDGSKSKTNQYGQFGHCSAFSVWSSSVKRDACSLDRSARQLRIERIRRRVIWCGLD